MQSRSPASLAIVTVAPNRVATAPAERNLDAPMMPSTIDVFSRRHRGRALLRAIAIPALAALVFTGFDAQSAEAAIRTAFRNASPRTRQIEAQIKNGSRIKLGVELWDGNKGIPNQVITFYVVIDGKKKAVGKAKTDSRGRATVLTPPIWVSGLAGPRPPRFITVTWYPVWKNKAPYLPPQNNLLGTGFRVLP